MAEIDWMWVAENPKEAADEIERLSDECKAFDAQVSTQQAEIERLTKERDLALANADAVYARLMPENERLQARVLDLERGTYVSGLRLNQQRTNNV